ncbi:MAG: hypothetical protein WBG57_14375 [Ornithinimicrobium sp.]
MQASVHEFDERSGEGELLLDTGVVIPFDADVFAASGLRLLRVGQRLSIERGASPGQTTESGRAEAVTRMWIIGIGDTETIL